jgi:hypothetical protein
MTDSNKLGDKRGKSFLAEVLVGIGVIVFLAYIKFNDDNILKKYTGSLAEDHPYILLILVFVLASYMLIKGIKNYKKNDFIEAGWRISSGLLLFLIIGMLVLYNV